MSDFVFNVTKGRFAGNYDRVQQGDPAGARLFLIPVHAGAVTDATLRDLKTFAAVIAAGVTERAANGWGRKVYAAGDLAALVPDDVSDRMDVALPNPTWVAPTVDAVTDLVLCYSPVSAPTNSQLVPQCMVDFMVVPDGLDVIAGTSTGIFRAREQS
jgi:hypothetical protein